MSPPRPRAVELLRDGAQLTETELRKYLEGKLARYKIPKSVLFVDEMPRTTSGKIKKADLRKQSTTQLCRPPSALVSGRRRPSDFPRPRPGCVVGAAGCAVVGRRRCGKNSGKVGGSAVRTPGGLLAHHRAKDEAEHVGDCRRAQADSQLPQAAGHR